MDDIIKTMLYVQGFGIHYLVPFIDRLSYSADSRLYIGKTTRPVISFLGYATKSVRYRFSCIDYQPEERISNRFSDYVRKYGGGNQALERLKGWRTWYKYIVKE